MSDSDITRTVRFSHYWYDAATATQYVPGQVAILETGKATRLVDGGMAFDTALPTTTPPEPYSIYIDPAELAAALSLFLTKSEASLLYAAIGSVGSGGFSQTDADALYQTLTAAAAQNTLIASKIDSTQLNTAISAAVSGLLSASTAAATYQTQSAAATAAAGIITTYQTKAAAATQDSAITNLQGLVSNLVSLQGTAAANLTTVTPAGSISSTNVQAALQELDLDIAAAQSAISTLQTTPAGVKSTVGLGLPSTTGRSAGDLHYDRVAGREYVLIVDGVGTKSWASSSGAVNTSAAGLPPFTGRVAGDHAFETTAGKDYVLSGTPGTSFTDTFSGTDGSVTTTESGGLSYAAGNSSTIAQRTGGAVSFPVAAYTSAFVNIGSGGAQEVSADVVFPASGTAEVHLLLRANSTGSSGYDLSIESNRIKIGRGSFVTSALLATINSGSRPASGRYTFSVDGSATAPTLSAYLNGVLIGQFTDSTGPQTGTYVGLAGQSQTGSIASLDNINGFTPGTLAWTQSQPAGIQSTTGFGLPTTTGRGDGDLHYDRSIGRQYELVAGAWALSGGTTNTVAAGLPGFAGRYVGDHAFETGAGKDYVLTGTAAANFGDDFARADVTPLAVDSAGAAYKIGAFNQTPVATLKIVGGKVKASSGTTGAFTNLTKNLGNQTSAVTVSVKATQASSVSSVLGLQKVGFVFASPDPSSNVARTSMILVRVSFSSSGTDSGTIDVDYFDGAGSSTSLLNSTAAGFGLPTATSAVFSATLSADRKSVTVYRNGVLIGTSAAAAAAVTGAHYGVHMQMRQDEGTESLDDLSIIAAGSLAWTLAQPVGPQSTTGFGLPTTTGRTDGDLHFDKLSSREYVLSGGSWVSSSGPTSTSQPGLPSLTNRLPGDLAFDTTAGKQYVLTGVAGSTFSDDFSSGSLSGYVNVNNTGAAGSGSMAITGGRLSEGNALVHPTGLYRSLGTGVGHSVQSDVIYPASVANLFNLGVVVKATTPLAQGDGYAFVYTASGGGYNLQRNGTVVATYTDSGGAPTNSTKTMALTATTAGVVTAYLNGAQVMTYTDASPLNGQYAGVEMNESVANEVFFDNLFLGVLGTLAWSLTQPATPQADLVSSVIKPGIYIPPGWGANLKAKLASKGKIAVVGDSVSRGYYASNLDTTSWPGLLKSRLQTAYGDGGSGWKGAVDSPTWATAASIPAAAQTAYGANGCYWTITGTWSNYSSNAFGIGGASIKTTAAGATAQITVKGSTIKIFTIGGNSAWQYQIDGGTVTAGTIGSYQTVNATTITGLSAGTHTVKILYNGNGSTDTLYLNGVSGENASGIVVDNFSVYGSGSGLVNNTDGLTGGLGMGGNLYPSDLVIYGMGLNDAGNNLAPQTFLSNVERYIAGVRDGGTANGNVDLMFVIQHAGKYDDTNRLMAQYASGLRGLADNYQAAIVNVWSLYKNSYNAFNTLNGWANATSPGTAGSDAVHLSDAGNTLVYNAVNSVIAAAIG